MAWTGTSLPALTMRVAFAGGLLALAIVGASAAAAGIDDEPDNDRPLLALDTGGHTSAVYEVMVTHYGDRLISVGLDKTIRLWDLATGEPLRVLRPAIGPGAHGYLFSAALSPDDQLLAVGTYRAQTPLLDHRIHLVDLDTGRIVHSLKGHSYTIYDLDFSPDGTQLASASHDGTVRIWNVADGTTTRILRGHTEPVHGVAWSADARHLVSGSLDKTARIWSVEDGATVATLREHRGEVMTVGWSPDGRTVATGCYDKSIRLYEPSGKLRTVWSGLANEVMSLEFSPDSTRILFTYGSNASPPSGAEIRECASGRKVVGYTGHANSPLCCGFKPDGKLAVTGDVLSRIRIWDTTTGATVHRLDGRGESKISAGWSPDGQAIAWGTRIDRVSTSLGGPIDRTFCLRQLRFGDPPDATFVRSRAELGGLGVGFRTAQQPVDMRTVVFTRNNSLVRSFTLPQPYDQIRCYTLMPEDMAVVGTKNGAYLYNVKTGQVDREMSERGEELWGLAPSPDWRYVLTAGNDQVMRIWNVESGDLLLAVFIADEEWIAWTPQGHYAASLAGESLMGWHINRGPERLADFYPASRFRKSLYRPEVIRRVLEQGSVARAVEAADRERNEVSQVHRVVDALPATVEITTPDSQSVELTDASFTIRARAEPVGEQPITAMRLVVDGRPVGPARPIDPPADKPAAVVEQEWTVDLPPGSYGVAVQAETARSHALSPRIEVRREVGNSNERPRLFILAVGDNTVKTVADAFSATASGVYSDVVVRAMTSTQATPSAVDAAIEEIRGRATLADTTLVYVAGRESADADGGYLLTASGGDGEPRTAISGRALGRNLATVAGKVMLAIDATHVQRRTERRQASGFCGAEAAEDDRDRVETAAADLLRDLLTEDHGVMVMRSVSEPDAANRGGRTTPFAQAVVEAIDGGAEADGDSVITVEEFSRFVVQRVRDLTGGRQRAIVDRPVGMRSFPLAKPVAKAADGK